MARVVDIRTVDDIDGGPADETVSYSLDGVDYQIDLSESNAAEFRALLKPWVEQSRRAPNRRGGRRQQPARQKPGEGNAAPLDSSAVRRWAIDNGIEVSERGRLPSSVVEQYVAAHGL